MKEHLREMAIHKTLTRAANVGAGIQKNSKLAWLDLILSNQAVQYLALAGFTLVALVLRLYKLGEWSMWGDEIITVSRSLNLFDLNVLPSPSLILTKYVLEIWGVNDFNARLVPALIGSISLPLLFFPIRKIFGRDIALTAIFFLAISPWHIYWSQNARFYTALLLFFNLAMFVFYQALEEDSLPYLLLAFVCVGLAVLERLIAFFIVPVIAGYLTLIWILRYQQPPGFRVRNLLFLLLPGLIGGVIFGQKFFEEVIEFFRSYNSLAINSPVWILGGMIAYIGIPTIALGLAGLVYLILQRKREGLILGLGAFVPTLATVFISMFGYTANRYAFIALLSWILLASIALVELLKKTRGMTRWLALSPLLIMVLMFMSENGMYYFYQHGNRANWKAALAYVQQNQLDGDLLYTSAPRVAEYYLESDAKAYRTLDFPELVDSESRIWILEDVVGVTYWPEIHQAVRKNAQLVEVFDVQVEARSFLMRVYLYDPRVP